MFIKNHNRHLDKYWPWAHKSLSGRQGRCAKGTSPQATINPGAPRNSHCCRGVVYFRRESESFLFFFFAGAAGGRRFGVDFLRRLCETSGSSSGS